MENINNIDHLRSITKDAWDKLNKITHVVKRLIRDHMQINVAFASFDPNSNPYQQSKATLLGDIHRVRRYLYHKINKLHLVSYLSHDAVELAIEEVRKTYDDDGKVLMNIRNYLRTFCLNNLIEDESVYEQRKSQWADEIIKLSHDQKTSNDETTRCLKKLENYKRDLKITESRTNNIIEKEKLVLNNIKHLKEQNANEIKEEYYNDRRKAISDLDKLQKEHEPLNKLYADSVAKTNNIKKQIESLEKLKQLKLEDQQKKLIIKYGRGLLLYGPPGTG